MCGIAGRISLKAAPPEPEQILTMCAAIHHRGPDATGYGVYGPDALGNTRLKIIDLSAAGNQPISNESRNVHVVHNGEIYNHRELRAALIRDGHRFQGYSDTEVLVHLYEEMGMSFVEKLDGMFALALSDERNQQLVLARDRAGKKPLFYYRSTEIFAFGSEIKALLTDPRVPAEVAVEFLAAYLSFGYVPCPYTLYRGIRQLEPGHVAVLHSGELRIEPFWKLRMQPQAPIRFEEACEQIQSILRQAVKKRLISDVPLGVLLSGGGDSSVVTALASEELGKVKTFCAVFPEDSDFNESSFVQAIAKHFGTDHHELEVRPQASDLLPAETLQRRKMGFVVPLRRWFRTDIKNLVHEMLLSPSARLNEFLRPGVVARFVTEQLGSRLEWTNHLWLLLTLEILLRSRRKLFGRPLSDVSSRESITA